jgi:hypothetical protein
LAGSTSWTINYGTADALSGCVLLVALIRMQLLTEYCCEGEYVWASYGDNNNDNESGGGEKTLPYTLACTVKSRLGPRRHSTARREEEEEEEEEEEGGVVGACCLARVGLSSYLYRQYVTCVPPAYARGRIHPITLS